MKQLIGIDVGGTKCAVILGQIARDIPLVTQKEQFATADYPTPQMALNQIGDRIERMTGGDLTRISGIGISCGGPLNSLTGTILSPPNLPGWDAVEITDYFRGRFHVPAHLQNDANACAVAEWRYGAGKGCRNMAFLTFGTGLGAGLILNGKLYTGASDMAGELGHWRMEPFGPVGYGKAGSFEGFCSGGGIAQLTHERLTELAQQGKFHPLFRKEVTAKAVFELARTGDALCSGVVATAAEYFGRGLALLIDLLNLEVIVAGGIFARNYDLLRPGANEVIQRESLAASQSRCRIVPAMLGEAIGDIAALVTAL